MAVLTVENATKRFGRLVAADQVSFEAREGRILGLLGPNGAGKTTTIRMITYITVPDEGRILFDGQPVGPQSQARMGYLPEERGLYKKLKVEQQLTYLGELKGLNRKDALQKVRYWLGRFDAHDWGGKKTEELSKGMQQKIQFISAILHDPELIILDEPFSGLDPINSELLRDIIYELKGRGRTILFASHRMEQVEQLCDDICLISRGKILLKGPLREIKQSFGRNTIIIEFEGDGRFLDQLERERLVRVGSRSHHRAEMLLIENTHEVRNRVLEAAKAGSREIYRYELVEPPLNEIFVTVIGNSKAAKGQPVGLPE